MTQDAIFLTAQSQRAIIEMAGETLRLLQKVCKHPNIKDTPHIFDATGGYSDGCRNCPDCFYQEYY